MLVYLRLISLYLLYGMCMIQKYNVQRNFFDNFFYMEKFLNNNLGAAYIIKYMRYDVYKPPANIPPNYAFAIERKRTERFLRLTIAVRFLLFILF